ncbi:WD-40 repeat-containing [Micractinium conductrix]|uniref:WD-40 repeat-containing n=1 Tax=Micractinium conductrix TaxID=554055 RepID=A0A2P6UZD4_9CHLO|nr:WD-40 repeat-containing [Micractinium conductrix]|eukprot:PSC67197.1 WD-40 repeat-containing [Micractinium conductrix]
MPPCPSVSSCSVWLPNPLLQLRSSGPVCREWTTDASAVHLAAIHGSGKQRLTLAAQGSTVELRCVAPAAKSFQLYGHTARLSCAKVLRPGGSGAAVQRLGVVTASHDQTIRLWSGNAEPDSYDFQAQPLSLLTPLRTLRGHQESVTCLQLAVGSMGVTIAATGSKDRVVRLWGLAPLMPSPVHKPQIATLRVPAALPPSSAPD